LDTFRCPTCVTLLPDPYAKRCFACGQSLYRRPPKVLGEEHRIGANLLPIDRWMLDRLQPERRRSLFGRNRNLPPVAWHGRFATSARTPELEPAYGADMPAAARVSPEPTIPAYDPMTPDYDDTPQQPATVGALALDIFVQPNAAPETVIPEPVLVEPLPDEDALDAFFGTPVAPYSNEPEPELFAAPPVPPPAPPAPVVRARPVVPHEELDPEVRALVDELYEQARAELSGTETIDSPAYDESRFGADDSIAPDAPVPTTEPPHADDVAAPHDDATRARRGWVPAAFMNEQEQGPRPTE
jgi:hypothetical protein